MNNFNYEMIDVNSPSLAYAGYDKETKTMAAVLRTPFNKIYFYKDVPQNVWEGFLESEEQGVYFAVKIRNRYKYTVNRRADYIGGNK